MEKRKKFTEDRINQGIVINTKQNLISVCNGVEYMRAESMFTKEPNTIKFIDNMGPNDVFYDIGANIGIYTIYAGRKGIQVVAFEPSTLNAGKLLENIKLNMILAKVQIFTSPLYDEERICGFSYSKLLAGTAQNSVDGNGGAWTEIKRTAKLDSLAGRIPDATHLKIDVDGHELNVLRGATGYLSKTVRAVQVEVREDSMAAVSDLLMGFGFERNANEDWKLSTGEYNYLYVKP